MSKYVLKSNSGNGYAADPKKTKTGAAYTGSLSKAMKYSTAKAAEADKACGETVVSVDSLKEVK